MERLARTVAEWQDAKHRPHLKFKIEGTWGLAHLPWKAPDWLADEYRKLGASYNKDLQCWQRPRLSARAIRLRHPAIRGTVNGY